MRASGATDAQVKNVWKGSQYEDDSRGECDDSYYQLAFRGIDPLDAEFEEAALTMFAPMRAAMDEEPIP